MYQDNAGSWGCLGIKQNMFCKLQNSRWSRSSVSWWLIGLVYTIYLNITGVRCWIGVSRTYCAMCPCHMIAKVILRFIGFSSALLDSLVGQVGCGWVDNRPGKDREASYLPSTLRGSYWSPWQPSGPRVAELPVRTREIFQITSLWLACININIARRSAY